jgi:hypothetical protein
MTEENSTYVNKRNPIRWSKRSSNWKRHLQEFQQFQEQKIVRRSYTVDEEPIQSLELEDDDDTLTENSDDSEVILDEDEVSVDNYENFSFEPIESASSSRRRSG